MPQPSPSLTGVDPNTPDPTGTAAPIVMGSAAHGDRIYGVDQNAAINKYLPGHIQAIGDRAAAVGGENANLAQSGQAAGPSPSLVSQSAATPINQQGFNAQAQNLAQLQAQSRGEGPAAQAVQMQANQQQAQGMNAQLALAGSMRGGNAGEAMRQASVGQAQVTGQAANQAAMNTLQSEQQGITNAGAVAGSMQGESLQGAQLGQQNNQFNAGATNTANLQTQQLGTTTAISNAANTQQTNLANAATQNDLQARKDAMIADLMAKGMSMQDAQAQTLLTSAEHEAGSQADQYQANHGHAISQQSANAGTIQAGAAAVGAAGNFVKDVRPPPSDKRAKKDIKKGDNDTSDFLDHLKAHTWEYKKPDEHGHGRFLGVMAQDLEKSNIGKKLVEPDPDGLKRVNYGGAYGMAAIVASLAMLNEKIKKMEALKGRR